MNIISFLLLLASISTTQEARIKLLLGSKDPEDRADGARIVGEEKSRAHFYAVIKLLKDPHVTVRCWAGWALGEFGDPRAIGPLIKAMVKYHEIAKTDQAGWESKCLTSFYLALEKLTGKRFGLDALKWQQWWMSENWES